MNRNQLEHIIRAAGAIAKSKKLIIIGSQAILGMYPDAPESLVSSMEADIYPANEPEKADLIDGSIGEESIFHETFGYYAHGIGPETATLPANWKSRLIVISNKNTHFIQGLCLHPVDLAISKLFAGRDKDINFVKQLIENNFISINDIENCLNELSEEKKERLKRMLRLL